jgi:hypothetical protein
VFFRNLCFLGGHEQGGGRVIPKKPNRCRAVLKTGVRCRNQGKPEFNGFCGVHRQSVRLEKSSPETVTPSTKVERLQSIVAIASGLAVLLDKAIERLPQLVEIATHISRIAFWAPTEEGLDKAQKNFSPDGYTAMWIPTTSLPSSVRRFVDGKNLAGLMTFLHEELPLSMKAGNVPEDLLRDIQESRLDLIRELTALGVEPLPVVPSRAVTKQGQ